MGVRFAPSPTGRFHLGNLRTAWISHFLAKRLGLPWVVRFEDIDTPRVIPEAVGEQLQDLETLGMVPDRFYLQSDRLTRHIDLFERARDANLIYPCTCSRKDVREALEQIASAPHHPIPVYSGHCRDQIKRPQTELPTLAWRMKMPQRDGAQDQIIGRTLPDGSDFTPAYHWACAIDDWDGAYALLVRASDLASSLEVQREIFRLVSHLEERNSPPPAVFHTSLVLQNDGSRLEKRTQGVTLPELLEHESKLELIERLERSFVSPAFGKIEPQKIYQEPRETISLKDLGLRSPD